MTRDQKIVGIGAGSGVATMIATVVSIYQLWPSNPNLTEAIARTPSPFRCAAFGTANEIADPP